jgi:hypothetical protein
MRQLQKNHAQIPETAEVLVLMGDGSAKVEIGQRNAQTFPWPLTDSTTEGSEMVSPSNLSAFTCAQLGISDIAVRNGGAR